MMSKDKKDEAKGYKMGPQSITTGRNETVRIVGPSQDLLIMPNRSITWSPDEAGEYTMTHTAEDGTVTTSSITIAK